VEAASTGFLTFVTTSSGFTQARANATAHAPLVFLGAVSRFNRI
jgi:hypothetical protein